MDWNKLSTSQFVEWLSLEGLDGMDLINQDFDNVPWPLRIAIIGMGKSYPGSISYSIDYPHDIELSRLLFRPRLLCWDARSPIGYLIDGVAEILGPGPVHTREELDELLKIQAGETAAITRIEKEFKKYTDRIAHYFVCRDDENWAAKSTEEWESVWQKAKNQEPYEAAIIVQGAPIELLDRWRQEQAGEKDYIVNQAVINHRKSLPRHWIPAVLGDKSRGANVLANYLSRPEVPLELRKSLRRHPERRVEWEAWAIGEVQQAELDNLTPAEWEVLMGRENKSLYIAEQLIKHYPGRIEEWSATDPDLSDEIKMLVVAKHGLDIDWAIETNQAILLAGLEHGRTETLISMARAARRSWGTQLLKDLALTIIKQKTGDEWVIKRLFHLAGEEIVPDKEIIKALLTSPHKGVRLLGLGLSKGLARPGSAKQAEA